MSLKFKNLHVKTNSNGIDENSFEKMTQFFTNNGVYFIGHATDIESQIIDCNFFCNKKADFNKILSYNFPECIIGLSFY